jgi:hypothetical protein
MMPSLSRGKIMPQQQTRQNSGNDDDERESSWPGRVASDTDADTDTGYGSDHDDDFLKEVDLLIQEAPVNFTQKGGQ